MMDLSSFSTLGFGAMDLETGVSKKVLSTAMTSLGGFETAWVGVEEIGALFLATGAALDFD